MRDLMNDTLPSRSWSLQGDPLTHTHSHSHTETEERERERERGQKIWLPERYSDLYGRSGFGSRLTSATNITWRPSHPHRTHRHIFTPSQDTILTPSHPHQPPRSHLIALVHDGSNPGNEVGSLLTDLGSLVVQSPEDGPAYLGQVWLHPRTQRGHHCTETIQHYHILGEWERENDRMKT